MTELSFTERDITDVEPARVKAGFDRLALEPGKPVKESERFGFVATDGPILEETFFAWIANVNDPLDRLPRTGVMIERAPIDADELAEWCEVTGRDVDGAARAQFAAEKLCERHAGPSARRTA